MVPVKDMRKEIEFREAALCWLPVIRCEISSQYNFPLKVELSLSEDLNNT